MNSKAVFCKKGSSDSEEEEEARVVFVRPPAMLVLVHPIPTTLSRSLG
jgi:hypothetical protein